MTPCARATRGLRRTKGEQPDHPLARRTRTIKRCSSGARREGPFGCSPEGEGGKIGRPSPGLLARLSVPGWAGERVGLFQHPVRYADQGSSGLPRELSCCLLVRFLMSRPDRLIFGLGSVYRGWTMRETLDVKREAKDETDWLSVR